MKNATSRRRSIRGSSIPEASMFLVILTLGALGFGSTDAPKRNPELDQFHESQAIAIAEGQMAYVNGLAFDDLTPNTEFEAASWIRQPGHERGEIPVSVKFSGELSDEEQQVYTVSWRVAKANDGELLRNVSVRISWTDTGLIRRSYTLNNTRWR